MKVDGEEARVVEDLGFCHSLGAYAKVVEISGGEVVAVRQPGSKTWKRHVPKVGMGTKLTTN